MADTTIAGGSMAQQKDEHDILLGGFARSVDIWKYPNAKPSPKIRKNHQKHCEGKDGADVHTVGSSHDASITLLSKIGTVYPKSSHTGLRDMTDLAEKFDKNIRPLLDAVDRLRNLKVTNEGIPLPSIVVVGDQSSGKSSVLESLAMINLPRGQGIATRVPLVIRLESCGHGAETITISYRDYKCDIREDEIESAVDVATKILAGEGKAVTDAPISLHIRKPGAPNLTMIDLPGITRVPVHGQPPDIYEQIAAMIRFYIKPKETVILNVLSATVDFTTCESIRMSQQEDKEGERTLAVVTKVDRAPEGVYEKVTMNDVHIGLGYICVRNRTNEDRSHDEAREVEKRLFETHPALSRLDKATVGIGSLAERLTQIQADIIRRSLPGIHQQIEKALGERQKELESLTQMNGEDPTDVFLTVVDEVKNLLQEMMNGNYDKFEKENHLHYPPRMEHMFQNFNDKIRLVLRNILPSSKTEDILNRMSELRGLSLPNFLPPALMKSLVSEEIDKIRDFCTELVPETHDYARNFVYRIIDESTSLYPNLQATYKQEVEISLSISHASCMNFVNRVLEKERSNVFTINDYYISNIKKFQGQVAALLHKQSATDFGDIIEGFGSITLEGFEDPIDLQEVHSKDTEYQAAFALKVSLAAYWKVVHKRVADEIPQEIKFSLETAILKNLRNSMLKANLGHDLSNLMEEHPLTVQKKKTELRNRVDVLRECKEVLQSLF